MRDQIHNGHDRGHTQQQNRGDDYLENQTYQGQQHGEEDDAPAQQLPGANELFVAMWARSHVLCLA